MGSAGKTVGWLARAARAALVLGPVVAVAFGPSPASAVEPSDGRKGEPVATFQLAVRYEHGEGVARDPAKALELYCHADRAGHAGAAFAIGWIHANGRGGVVRDDDVAAAWFRKAAARGHAQAGKILRVIPGRDRVRVAECPRPANEIARAGAPGFGAAPEEVRSLVRDLAPLYRLDPALVLAVIAVESSFRSDAVSAKNAQGLMQLIPATAARFGVRDVFDPEENLRGGMAYLRWLLDQFAGNVQLAVAAYNAGENAVARHRGVPPYAETRAYVKKIQRLYPSAHHPV